MKRTQLDNRGQIINTQIFTWNSHRGNCAKCIRVDIEKSKSFALTCAEGGPLLMEELKKRAMPQRIEKEQAELEYAIHAGVFHLPPGSMQKRKQKTEDESKE